MGYMEAQQKHRLLRYLNINSTAALAGLYMVILSHVSKHKARDNKRKNQIS